MFEFRLPRRAKGWGLGHRVWRPTGKRSGRSAQGLGLGLCGGALRRARLGDPREGGPEEGQAPAAVVSHAHSGGGHAQHHHVEPAVNHGGGEVLQHGPRRRRGHLGGEAHGHTGGDQPRREEPKGLVHGHPVALILPRLLVHGELNSGEGPENAPPDCPVEELHPPAVLLGPRGRHSGVRCHRVARRVLAHRAGDSLGGGRGRGGAEGGGSRA
mmetsp:Transcript_17134/g.54757  ORF Transcript_17134/g.54757 Transcript_17134/m.54757 type:complete len:213 (-) Transcript_17134:211-849(-)